jgi:hypothetical protein
MSLFLFSEYSHDAILIAEGIVDASKKGRRTCIVVCDNSTSNIYITTPTRNSPDAVCAARPKSDSGLHVLCI